MLASFLVVFIHVPFYGLFGEIVKLYARIAVPIFFMTSGYFCYENDSKSILRRIKKIFLILVFTSCIYNISNLILGFSSEGVNGIYTYFEQFKNIEEWIKLLLFNKPFSATRLWFLFALIYVYLVQILINKYSVSYRIILFLSVSGILIHLLCGIVLPYYGFSVPSFLCRNFLFFGYPFFAIGLLFRRSEDQICSISNKKLFMGLIAGCCLSLSPLFYSTVAQFSVGTLFLVFVIFIYSLKLSSLNYSSWLIHLSKCSLGIYILHRPVATVIGKLLSFLPGLNHTISNGVLLPILVCICTTLLTLFLQGFIDVTNRVTHSKI